MIAWLPGLHIRGRYVIVYFIVLCLLLIIFQDGNARDGVVVLLAIGIGFIFGSVYLDGISVRYKVFKEHGILYEVHDTFYPTRHFDSHRILQCLGSNWYQSCIYLKSQKRWMYFDILRRILIKFPSINQGNVLVIGGGGGAVPITMSQQSDTIHVDLFETSHAMINIAKRFFHIDQYPHISIYEQDGYEYILSCGSRKYDLAFIDVFNMNVIPRIFQTDRFISHVLLVARHVVINFGSHDTHIYQLLERYNKKKKIYAYVYKSVVIASTDVLENDVHEEQHTRIL